MSDATPDGGERARHTSHELLPGADHTRDSGGDAWEQVGVVLVGCVVGLLAALEAGVGDPGSLPVTVVSVAGGLVATGVRGLWRRDRERRPADVAASSSEGELGEETACDAETLLEARSLAFLLDGRNVEVADGRVTFRSPDGRWDLHLEPHTDDGDSDR